MKNCPFCGFEVNDSAVICIKCGTDLSVPNHISNDSKNKIDLITIGLILIIFSFILSGFMLQLIRYMFPSIRYLLYSPSPLYLIGSAASTIMHIVGPVLCLVGYIKQKRS